jgi:hypothetical protein
MDGPVNIPTKDCVLTKMPPDEDGVQEVRIKWNGVTFYMKKDGPGLLSGVGGLGAYRLRLVYDSHATSKLWLSVQDEGSEESSVFWVFYRKDNGQVSRHPKEARSIEEAQDIIEILNVREESNTSAYDFGIPEEVCVVEQTCSMTLLDCEREARIGLEGVMEDGEVLSEDEIDELL